MTCAEFDIELKFAHIKEENNNIADLLSRWKNSEENIEKLKELAPNATWVTVTTDFLSLDFEI